MPVEVRNLLTSIELLDNLCTASIFLHTCHNNRLHHKKAPAFLKQPLLKAVP